MKNTIQTKRKTKTPSRFRKIYAKTTRRKLRAATATADTHMDLDSDVPNGGVGRSLMVILFLHVALIGAIYFHSKLKNSREQTAKVTSKQVIKAAAFSESKNVPSSNDRHIVETGDTYARIASQRNVDETSLRALNGGRNLSSGMVLDLPPQLSDRPVKVEETPIDYPEMAEKETPRRIYSQGIVVEKEKVAPVAIVVEESAINDSGQRHIVKSGETVWRIASRYKVSRESLLKINGITDPRKLYAGRKIKIPTN